MDEDQQRVLGTDSCSSRAARLLRGGGFDDPSGKPLAVHAQLGGQEEVGVQERFGVVHTDASSGRLGVQRRIQVGSRAEAQVLHRAARMLALDELRAVRAPCECALDANRAICAAHVEITRRHRGSRRLTDPTRDPLGGIAAGEREHNGNSRSREQHTQSEPEDRDWPEPTRCVRACVPTIRERDAMPSMTQPPNPANAGTEPSAATVPTATPVLPHRLRSESGRPVPEWTISCSLQLAVRVLELAMHIERSCHQGRGRL